MLELDTGLQILGDFRQTEEKKKKKTKKRQAGSSIGNSSYRVKDICVFFSFCFKDICVFTFVSLFYKKKI